MRTECVLQHTSPRPPPSGTSRIESLNRVVSAPEHTSTCSTAWWSSALMGSSSNSTSGLR
jgi:hypothetical protein